MCSFNQNKIDFLYSKKIDWIWKRNKFERWKLLEWNNHDKGGLIYNK